MTKAELIAELDGVPDWAPVRVSVITFDDRGFDFREVVGVELRDEGPLETFVELEVE